MYYFYEGRTIRGTNTVGWALLVQLGAVVCLGIVSAAVGVLYVGTFANPLALLGPFLGIIVAFCGIIIAEIAAAIVFLIGLRDIYAGRHEYGVDQTRALERAFILLIVYIVVAAVSVIYTTSSAFLPTVTGQSNLAGTAGTLVLAPLSALFAGLTLEQSVRTLAPEGERSRLRLALALGVVGAAVGPAMSLLVGLASSPTLDLVSAGIIGSALAGNGVAAISLLLFWLGYQETKRSLEAGNPRPVLPRIDQVYPWLYRPYYAYPSGPPPSVPPPKR